MTDLQKQPGTSGSVPAPLLEIRDLVVDFEVQGKPVPAVRGANLTVYPGQTVAIVGESGSGKSTTAAAVLGLLQGTGKVSSGQIVFDGQDLSKASEKDFQKIRGDGIGLVPQDPNSNLNPLWRVGFQIRETLKANNAEEGDAKKRAIELLAEAGMRDPEKRVNQYPHEFSGGMKQRALIAIGLACRPKLLIADEPTSALDVTVQRQILDHLETLTAELGTAVLLITHDLGLAAERASHLVVMYKGRVVESGPALDILQDPQHEYTKRLVGAAPSLAARRMEAPSVSDVLDRPIAVDGEGQDQKVLADTLVGEAEDSSVQGPMEVVVAANLVKDFPIRGSMPFQSSNFRAVDDVGFTMLRGTTTAGGGRIRFGQVHGGADGAGPARTPPAAPSNSTGSTCAPSRAARRRRSVAGCSPCSRTPTGHWIRCSRCTVQSRNRSWCTVSATRHPGCSGPGTLLEMGGAAGGHHAPLPERAVGRAAAARGDRPARCARSTPRSWCSTRPSRRSTCCWYRRRSSPSSRGLQKDLGLTYLFITHDLAVVKQIAHQTLVMSRGKVVDSGPTEQVYDNPSSDYTRTLIEAIPGGSIELAG